MKEVSPTWTEPPELQDHDRPPKRILQDLFRLHSKTYVETLHAPLALKGQDLDLLASRCSLRFLPFWTDLKQVCGLS